MGKMTNKEFREAFEQAGYNWDVWGYEGILNMISVLEQKNSDEAILRGCLPSARACLERSNKLYDILDERGYYNN